VKHVFNLATRIAAGKGFPRAVDLVEPSPQAIAALGDAGIARARAWEAVLLLGDPATVDAARTWWREVWWFVWFARRWLTDSEQWPIALAESDAARQRYLRLRPARPRGQRSGGGHRASRPALAAGIQGGAT
jgi:hypothetical protein